MNLNFHPFAIGYAESATGRLPIGVFLLRWIMIKYKIGLAPISALKNKFLKVDLLRQN